MKAGRDAGRAGRAGWVQLGGWCAVRVRVLGWGGGARGVSVGNGVSCRGSRESRHLNKTASG